MNSVSIFGAWVLHALGLQVLGGDSAYLMQVLALRATKEGQRHAAHNVVMFMTATGKVGIHNMSGRIPGVVPWDPRWTRAECPPSENFVSLKEVTTKTVKSQSQWCGTF